VTWHPFLSYLPGSGVRPNARGMRLAAAEVTRRAGGGSAACFSFSSPLIFLYCYSSELLLLRSMARGLHMPVRAAWFR